MKQRPLFVPPDQPCQACRGTGLRDTRHTDPLAAWQPANPPACLSCGGSGLEKDRPDPEQDPLPEGY